MELIFEEDQANKPVSTALTKQSIDPDCYSKMGVKEALAPYHFETIGFACLQLAKLLPNCSETDLLLDPKVQQMGGCFTASSEGYEAEKLDQCLEILKERLRALHENCESADIGQINYFQARLLHIEYSIAVHGIFTS